MRDELMEFLESFPLVFPNLNDTFAYATADTERLYMDDPPEEPFEHTNMSVLVDVWCRWKHDGVIAYVAHVRKMEPLPQRRSDAYVEAKQWIEATGWEYEGD